jgi:hypothetical protein
MSAKIQESSKKQTKKTIQGNGDVSQENILQDSRRKTKQAVEEGQPKRQKKVRVAETLLQKFDEQENAEESKEEEKKEEEKTEEEGRETKEKDDEVEIIFDPKENEKKKKEEEKEEKKQELSLREDHVRVYQNLKFQIKRIEAKDEEYADNLQAGEKNLPDWFYKPVETEAENFFKMITYYMAVKNARPDTFHDFYRMVDDQQPWRIVRDDEDGDFMVDDWQYKSFRVLFGAISLELTSLIVGYQMQIVSEAIEEKGQWKYLDDGHELWRWATPYNYMFMRFPDYADRVLYLIRGITEDKDGEWFNDHIFQVSQRYESRLNGIKRSKWLQDRLIRFRGHRGLAENTKFPYMLIRNDAERNKIEVVKPLNDILKCTIDDKVLQHQETIKDWSHWRTNPNYGWDNRDRHPGFKDSVVMVHVPDEDEAKRTARDLHRMKKMNAETYTLRQQELKWDAERKGELDGEYLRPLTGEEDDELDDWAQAVGGGGSISSKEAALRELAQGKQDKDETQGNTREGSTRQRGEYPDGSTRHRGEYPDESTHYRGEYPAGSTRQRGEYPAGSTRKRGEYPDGSTRQRGEYSDGSTCWRGEYPDEGSRGRGE